MASLVHVEVTHCSPLIRGPPPLVYPALTTPKIQDSLHAHDVGPARAGADAVVVATIPTAPSQCLLEHLPSEIIDQILAYLVHPLCRLPGLTQTQSSHTFSKPIKSAIRNNQNLTLPSDTTTNIRWAADLFSLHALPHPFNALSLTSRRCHVVIEAYCAHLVRICNAHMFNLPFAQFDEVGKGSVWPDLSAIVYRRLWLQFAPRRCVYCEAVLDAYPFKEVDRVMATCADCFYAQTLSLAEITTQYHITSQTILSHPTIRRSPHSIWVLRIDVEALALSLYGTRAFHAVRPEQTEKPCEICAITRFNLDFRQEGAKKKEGLGGRRKKAAKRGRG